MTISFARGWARIAPTAAGYVARLSTGLFREFTTLRDAQLWAIAHLAN